MVCGTGISGLIFDYPLVGPIRGVQAIISGVTTNDAATEERWNLVILSAERVRRVSSVIN
jgi:hypothetical protein